MDDPGNPEHYQVLPNAYKGEGGTYVEGRGRVYFVLCKRENTGATQGMPELKLNVMEVDGGQGTIKCGTVQNICMSGRGKSPIIL